MLYKHPRGVGCEKCHGEFGEGKLLGSYTENKKTGIKENLIQAPSIQTTSLDKMLEATSIKKDKKSVMPTYFLTKSEIDAIVFYINKKNERKKSLEKNSTQN